MNKVILKQIDNLSTQIRILLAKKEVAKSLLDNGCIVSLKIGEVKRFEVRMEKEIEILREEKKQLWNDLK